MSRYYDYDYDRNCIIGFGPDDDDVKLDKLSTSSSYSNIYNLDITPASSQSGDSYPNPPDHNLSPSSSASISTHQNDKDYSPDLLLLSNLSTFDNQCICDDDDIFFILPADSKAIKQQKLKPLDLDVPFLLVGDMVKQQQYEKQQKKQNKKTQQKSSSSQSPAPTQSQSAVPVQFGDTMNAEETDCNLWIQPQCYITDEMHCEQIQRIDDFNGSYYNTFGKEKVSKNQCRIWRLQLFGNAPAIIGIIEDTAPQQTSGAYFGHDTNYKSYSFNTITASTYQSMHKSLQPIYQQMLQSGRLDKPMIIDYKLDLQHGTMSIANVTPGCTHYGKEIFLFDQIDTTKSYKLGIAMLGPEIINLF